MEQTEPFLGERISARPEQIILRIYHETIPGQKLELNFPNTCIELADKSPY
jgi:hypothetical protein